MSVKLIEKFLHGFVSEDEITAFESRAKEAHDMLLNGTVRNVVDFGCFVDIGVHHDGLLHISEMSDRFIKHPSELFKTGDVIEVRIKDVDVKKHRTALTRKGMNTPKN